MFLETTERSATIVRLRNLRNTDSPAAAKWREHRWRRATMGARMPLRFYDFFAGAGLATLGLQQSGWRCIWANDIDPRKHAVYTANFGDQHFELGDLAQIPASRLPAPAELAWASFPCQDLSLAGWRKGLSAG